ncbi:hypothetical protein V8E53_008304 [Lactarius tabidus]
MIGGGAGSSSVAGIGLGSTHSSLSRPAESDDILVEPAPGVPGAAGSSSSVPPLLWPLSEAERKESRLLIIETSPASAKESFSSSSRATSPTPFPVPVAYTRAQ